MMEDRHYADQLYYRNCRYYLYHRYCRYRVYYLYDRHGQGCTRTQERIAGKPHLSLWIKRGRMSPHP